MTTFSLYGKFQYQSIRFTKGGQMTSNKQIVNPDISNPYILLNLAAKAMAAPCVDRDVVHKIGFWQGQLVCIPYHSVAPGMHTAGKLSPSQLKKGLSGDQWDRLGSALSILAWRIHLCPKLPEPYQVNRSTFSNFTSPGTLTPGQKAKNSPATGQ